jgi:hypothetical protein
MKYGITPALIMVLMLSCRKDKGAGEPETTIDPMPQFAVSVQNFELNSMLLKREISYTRNNPLLKNVRLFNYDKFILKARP